MRAQFRLELGPACWTEFAAERLAAVAPAATGLTNCLGVALALGQTPDLRVVLCPGDYGVREGATFGP